MAIFYAVMQTLERVAQRTLHDSQVASDKLNQYLKFFNRDKDGAQIANKVMGVDDATRLATLQSDAARCKTLADENLCSVVLAFGRSRRILQQFFFDHYEIKSASRRLVELGAGDSARTRLLERAARDAAFLPDFVIAELNAAHRAKIQRAAAEAAAEAASERRSMHAQEHQDRAQAAHDARHVAALNLRDFESARALLTKEQTQDKLTDEWWRQLFEKAESPRIVRAIALQAYRELREHAPDKLFERVEKLAEGRLLELGTAAEDQRSADAEVETQWTRQLDTATTRHAVLTIKVKARRELCTSSAHVLRRVQTRAKTRLDKLAAAADAERQAADDADRQAVAAKLAAAANLERRFADESKHTRAWLAKWEAEANAHDKAAAAARDVELQLHSPLAVVQRAVCVEALSDLSYSISARDSVSMRQRTSLDAVSKVLRNAKRNAATFAATLGALLLRRTAPLASLLAPVDKGGVPPGHRVVRRALELTDSTLVASTVRYDRATDDHEVVSQHADDEQSDTGTESSDSESSVGLGDDEPPVSPARNMLGGGAFVSLHAQVCVCVCVSVDVCGLARLAKCDCARVFHIDRPKTVIFLNLSPHLSISVYLSRGVSSSGYVLVPWRWHWQRQRFRVDSPCRLLACVVQRLRFRIDVLVSLLIRLTPYLSRTLIALLCISSQTRLRTKNLQTFLLRRRHWLLSI